MAGGEGILDELQETARGMAGNDVEGDENVARTDEVLVVGIKHSEIVFRAVSTPRGRSGGSPVRRTMSRSKSGKRAPRQMLVGR